MGACVRGGRGNGCMCVRREGQLVHEVLEELGAMSNALVWRGT